jgi:hypothetical protein
MYKIPVPGAFLGSFRDPVDMFRRGVADQTWRIITVNYNYGDGDGTIGPRYEHTQAAAPTVKLKKTVEVCYL